MILAIGGVSKAAVTGAPDADGWTLVGHSLENGVYVDGSANYGFNAYGTGFTIQAGSSLEIAAGSLSWLAGDTVLGAGGKFVSITAEDAGWTAFTGNSVNSLLSNSTGPKLQAKFGTSAAAWTTSTVAPGSGNADGSGSLGGGRVQIRTGTYYDAEYWSGNAGILSPLAKDSHIEWVSGGTVNASVGRMIWTFDSTTQEVADWELFLNVSLLSRLNPDYAGLLPDIGDMAIITVQDNDGAYTNALIPAVPEPATMCLLGLGALGLLSRKK